MARAAQVVALLALALGGCFLSGSGTRAGDGSAEGGDGGPDGGEDAEVDADLPPPPSCFDGERNNGESDVDCGGGLCAPCAEGRRCDGGADCASGVCVDRSCMAPSCDDGVQNGGEDGLDCGGPCATCPHGQPCTAEGGECGPFGVCRDGRCDVVGDGGDGVLLVGGRDVVLEVAARAASAAAGGKSISVVGDAGAFSPGQRAVIHQSRGQSAGAWELVLVLEIGAGELVLAAPLRNEYRSGGADRAQVVAVPSFEVVEVGGGGCLLPRPWDGATGGILALAAADRIVVEAEGALDASARGYRGGAKPLLPRHSAGQGEGTLGEPDVSVLANGTGGGGGGRVETCGYAVAGGGGGGGHAALGAAGQIGSGCQPSGAPGRAAGGDAASRVVFGGGGGAGAADDEGTGAAGGQGGGIVLLLTRSLEIAGRVTVDGAGGGAPDHIIGCGSGGGGGGAGGSFVAIASTARLGTDLVTARGGAGWDGDGACSPAGGAGAPGRVFVVAGSVAGESSPHWTGEAICGRPGACPSEVAGTCEGLTHVIGDRRDGTYWVDPDGRGAMQAHCDMTSDGGGYTMLRIDDPVLAANQTVYAYLCALVGMEVLVPRSRDHAFAVQAWNLGVVPNLVNVFPAFDRAEGLGSWHGTCRGVPCSFWVSESDDADCGDGTEPNGNNSVSYRLLRRGDPCEEGRDYGRWDDDGNNVVIQGWVLCSPNDR